MSGSTGPSGTSGAAAIRPGTATNHRALAFAPPWQRGGRESYTGGFVNRQAAHNTATGQVFRRRGRNPAAFLTLEDVEARADTSNVEESADRERALERLLALVHQLGPLDRQVMSAYLEDLKADEIADITGLSVSNVWTRIHRIKNLLKRQFNQGVPHVR